ncbi:hypothetical protein DL768_004716 [Monosporascus sp. mg162]|nr:hypothetical protein DL768_004716 [Monosporascus sp. mg162]
MEFITLTGESCFTAPEAKKLRDRINKSAPVTVSTVSGSWVYYAHVRGDAAAAQQKLKQLLPLPDDGSSPSNEDGSHARKCYVAPRNISPWSSQATNVAHVVGFADQLVRIERGRVVTLAFEEPFDDLSHPFRYVLYDRMTENFSLDPPDLAVMFAQGEPAPLKVVDIFSDSQDPLQALKDYNKECGLAMDQSEMEYLVQRFSELGRPPNDVELFMFAQVNSEHCRHKQFNAHWTIDGVSKDRSLFDMIRNTHKVTPDHTVSAYSDNAAVMEGFNATFWGPDHLTRSWKLTNEPVQVLAKVETHNHPTAIAPFPGAATGSGGEIRDETLLMPEESGNDKAVTESGEWRGYHKPIMIAGGVGTVRPSHALKRETDVHNGAHVIVLGGPAMLIGLGGGAASSSSGGENADLDFDSVQRGNPEMERRAQMVINSCVALGDESPIAFIHDVGAGGLSNALPELVKDAGYGGRFELREVESADSSMSPLQIWCNEAQERYVLLVNRSGLERFVGICQRERCGYSLVGTVSKEPDKELKLVVTDRGSKDYPYPVDLPMNVLFPKGRRLERDVSSRKPSWPKFNTAALLKKAAGDQLSDSELFKKAVERVLRLPAVGSKSFLITIADRTVGGLAVRDQMVGPWQIPVADVAVTATSFDLKGTRTGEAMAMGEKPTLALISPAASARMAVAESLMNLGAAYIKGGRISGDLRRVKLSANWMAAVNHPGEGAALYEAVEAIGMGMCPELGISIPVGKDSTSMKAVWKDCDVQKSVTAPVSVVISAFTVVKDVRRTWTPQLRRMEDVGETILMFVDLSEGRKAMGGSALSQTLGAVGDEAPDVRDVELLKDYFDAIAQLHESGVVFAYHDRSDGGLLTTVAEMMFAGRVGVELILNNIAKSNSLEDITEALFNEELGAVFQVRASDETNFKRCFATCGPPPGLIKKLGVVLPLTLRYGTSPVFASLERREMQQWWAKTSFDMQKLRDNPACAESEYNSILDEEEPGLSYNLTFSPSENILPMTASISGFFGKTPRVAILREQGVNGMAEMAFAFRAAGFDPVDVHMTDLIAGRSLAEFVGIAACGGFSYSDVLGAGQGWAKSILLHQNLRREFSDFFNRPDTFALGVCNGCQLLTRIKELIPGTEDWPVFVENESQQFEARYSMVKVEDNPSVPSVFLHGMNGSSLPIVVSHGEGRASFNSPDSMQRLSDSGRIALKYVDGRGRAAQRYPLNPNGSPLGVAGVTSSTGRVFALMPHPERTILADCASYVPDDISEWGAFGPWKRLFSSARRWVG